jgi:hypothetical protein
MNQVTVQGVVLQPDTVLANRNVLTGIQAAWDKTQMKRWEFGGWIYFNAVTQEYRTNEKTDKSDSGVILTPPPAFKGAAGYEIVADWHCHPGNDVAASRPSAGDIANGQNKLYFMFVVTPRKVPKAGWPADLSRLAMVLIDNPASYRIWHIL